MKFISKFQVLGLALSASATLAIPASAATFQLSNNLDNTFSTGSPPVFSTTVVAPYVGSMTLSYQADSALTNGSYAWTSLTTVNLSVVFPDQGGLTFTQAQLDTPATDIKIQVVDGNFFFTNINTNGSSTSLSGGTYGGSANFINGNYRFTTQPLNSETRTGFGGYVVDYNALYQLIDSTNASVGIAMGMPGYVAPTTVYKGNYGNPTANVSAATVPEPSAALLGALGTLALLRRRKR